MTEKLREQIRAAFPPAPFYGPITSCTCDECAEIKEGLQSKRWDEIPNAFLDLTCSPTLLDPESFHTFLPAYMLRALDDPSCRNVLGEFTPYCLSPDLEKNEGRQEWVRMSVALMTPEQTQAIRSSPQFFREKAENAEWYEPFIARAL